MFPRRRVSAECQRVLCGNSTFSQPQLASRGCWQLRYHKLNFNTCLSENTSSLHIGYQLQETAASIDHALGTSFSVHASYLK